MVVECSLHRAHINKLRAQKYTVTSLQSATVTERPLIPCRQNCYWHVHKNGNNHAFRTQPGQGHVDVLATTAAFIRMTVHTSGKNRTSRWTETRGPTNFHTSMTTYCPPCRHLAVDSHSQVTRGNNLRLQKDRFKYDLRKFCFSNRIINIWNSLPDFIVSANTTNIFKDRLDKFWVNRDILYDFKAQLHVTGSRSQQVYQV